MTEFKMPFHKVITVGCVFLFLASCVFFVFAAHLTYLLLIYFEIVKFRMTEWYLHILVISTVLIYWLGFFSFYFTFCYVRIHNDRIELRNIFNPFFSKEYHYSSLTNHYVRISTHTPGSRFIYDTRNISIIKKGKKSPGYFKQHYVRLVSQDDLLKIAEILKSKRVEVKIC